MSTNKCRLYLCFVTVIAAFGCRSESRIPYTEKNDGESSSAHMVRGRERKQVRGLQILVQEDLWDKFIEDKIVVDVEMGSGIAINSSHVSDESEAISECLRLSKAPDITGIVVILHDKASSANWVEGVCKDNNLDCLVHKAVGGADIGRYEALNWVHRGSR